MKKVYCLYRVSTKKQVDVNTDDIPMQKVECHRFAEAQGWEIVKEFSEKGVSGFKVHADDRDAIQELKKAALNHEFDILLVFMFDRIGRIDDETPFIVEWFVHNGIEVWSVKEGEQRFDSHVDKLMNYIRFWQASGESAKTSLRIKTRMKQLVEEGHYTMGVAPYGYKFVKRGRKNKKGNDVGDLVIDEEEAKNVRLVFDMCVRENKGTYVIARTLNDMGARTHNGVKFQANTINHMLSCKIYTGYLVTRQASSPKLEELVIIDEDTWNRAQKIIEQRKIANEANRRIPKKTEGQTLLSGNIFCGECGGRMVSTTYRHEYTKKDGTIANYGCTKYICYHRTRKLNSCTSQATYDASKIDNAIMKVVRDMFVHINDAPETDLIEQRYRDSLKEAKHEQKVQKLALEKLNGQLEKLQLEIGKALMGESAFSAEDLSNSIKTVKAKIAEAGQKLEEAERQANTSRSDAESIVPMFNRFISWAEEFDKCSIEGKRAIMCELIDRVNIYRGYRIEVVFNSTYEQFCNDWCLSEVEIA